MKLLLACCMLLAACGRSTSQRDTLRRFPIGMFGVCEPKHMARLKGSGFDATHCYATDRKTLEPLAREAEKLGMSLVAYPDEVMKGPPNDLASWPIDAWYLKDEPDVWSTPLAELEDLSRRVRAWDSQRPQTLVLGQGSAAARYGAVGDVLMLDWYPIPHLPLDSVADQLDEAQRHLPAGKPVWMVLQAFDWKNYAQRRPKEARVGRFPDHAEIRFMTYISILHGAKGIFYFTLNTKEGTLFDQPELWQAVARVARELKGLQPIFQRGKQVPLPFPPDPDGPEARAWRHHGRDYVILANRKAKVYQKVPAELLDPRWRPLYEARRDSRELLKPIKGAFYLKPYQVLVLESRLSLFR